MRRISNTIEMAKASWAVLRTDKELLALPLFSALASLVVVAGFIGAMFLAGVDLEQYEASPVQYVALFGLYVLLAFITIFFNSALVYAADDRLRGGDPTLGGALRGASMQVHRILPWALVSATVSMVLQAIEERAGAVGRVVSAIGGVAWSLVTFLVVPVIVMEDLGVFAAVKRSGHLFRKTWGENVAAQVGFGLLGFLLVLPAIPVVVLGALLGTAGIIVALVAAVLWVAFVAVAISALSGIFQTVLYHYAVSGEVPGGAFDRRTIEAAFAPRRRSGL